MFAIPLSTQSTIAAAGLAFDPIPEGRQTFTVIATKQLQDGSTKLTLANSDGQVGSYTVWSLSRGKTPESAQAMMRFTHSLLLAVFGRLDFELGAEGTGTFEHRIDDQGRVWANLVAA